MTEIAIHQPQGTNMSDVAEQWRWAETIANSDLIPDIYKRKPANILLAVGLGQAMGLSWAESLSRIGVIKGKPSASAELIASNVRKAGHRIRTEIAPDNTWARTTIWRKDDPDFPHVVTRDVAWAKAMGLLTNDNYRKQPGTMLSWRSISACARLACSEALYGVTYTTDELADIPDRPAPVTPQASDFAPRGVHDTPPVADDTVPETAPEPATRAQVTAMNAAMTARGLTQRTDKLDFLTDRIGRPIESSAAVTKDEASALLDTLHAEDQAAADPEADHEEPPASYWEQQEAQA